MPRQSRQKSPTGLYHITMRGVNKNDIFLDDEDYSSFLGYLQSMKVASGLQIYAYCLMKNHIHLLLKEEKEDLDPMPILGQAFEMAVGQDGWAQLAGMGNALYQLDPSFDPRTYGHKQLSRLIKSLKDQFEMRSHEIAGSPIIFVRMKE